MNLHTHLMLLCKFVGSRSLSADDETHGILDSQEYAPASDVYAFGVVMYEMLTWTLPFESFNPWQVNMHHFPELLSESEMERDA